MTSWKQLVLLYQDIDNAVAVRAQDREGEWRRKEDEGQKLKSATLNYTNYLLVSIHWNWIWVPFFLLMSAVTILDLEKLVFRPDAFWTSGSGQNGRLHSIVVNCKSLQIADRESLTKGNAGFLYRGHPIGWLMFHNLKKWALFNWFGQKWNNLNAQRTSYQILFLN